MAIRLALASALGIIAAAIAVRRLVMTAALWVAAGAVRLQLRCRAAPAMAGAVPAVSAAVLADLAVSAAPVAGVADRAVLCAP